MQEHGNKHQSNTQYNSISKATETTLQQPDLTIGGSKNGRQDNSGSSHKTLHRNHSYVNPNDGLPGWLVIMIAAVGGLAVANLYYVQPLLHAISVEFKTTTAVAGLLVTMNQIGFAGGLLLLVPVGDLVERRRMILVFLLLSSAALAAFAISPNLNLLEIFAVTIGVTSITAQILVSFVATVSTEQSRGAMVGRTMSGLLLGIVLARTASGALAQVAGWRSIYWTASAAMLAMSLLLGYVLPRLRPQITIGYHRLLHSVMVLFLEEPILRWRSLYGAVSFAAFNVLWTNLAFLLSGSPYHYNTVEIGLFGLAGAAGSLCASIAGKLTDRGYARIASIIFFSTTTLSFGLLALGKTSLLLLLAGIILLDLGVWGAQVSNQSLIYRLRPNAQSRITTVYMTSYFIGGAVGSSSSALLYAKEGWDATCALGAAFGFVAIVFWLSEHRRLGNYYARLTPIQRLSKQD